MEKNIFRFRRFDIRQDLCAMKVGTDGVLLGAWARVGGSVLDVGTGTGIIALMAAQRGAQSVCAIDVDADACRQASENVASSPFASAIVVENIPLQDYPASAFDAVVSNPPFFLIPSFHLMLSALWRATPRRFLSPTSVVMLSDCLLMMVSFLLWCPLTIVVLWIWRHPLLVFSRRVSVAFAPHP